MRKVHPRTDSSLLSKAPQSAKAPKNNDRHGASAIAHEVYQQAIYEARDGGKYVGYMRHEHGRFGSLPLYDDYSDNANAW